MVGGLASGTPSGFADLPFGLALVQRQFADPDGGDVLQRHATASVPYVIGVTALFAAYTLAIRVCGRSWSRGACALVLAFAGGFQVVGLLSPDMLSTDLFAYLIYGRIYAVYGASPYLEVPAQYPGDPFFDRVYWKYVPSFYGPLWTIVSGWLARLAGHDLTLAVALFKAVEVAAALGTAAVVALVLRRAAPSLALGGTLLVGWNPLVVVEGGLSGHNDVLLMFLLAVAVALALAARPALAVGSLVLASMIKITALPLIPLLGIYALRRAGDWWSGVWLVARCGVVGIAVAAVCLVPTWAGPETFAVATLGSSGDRYTNSLAELALGELRVWMGETREDTAVPLQFRGWWVATHTSADLRSGRDERALRVGQVPPWTALLVVGPERGGRLRVFDPETRQVGYVVSTALGPIDRPSGVDAEPEVLARERGPVGSPALQRANAIIRGFGWGSLGVVWLGAVLFGTGSLRALVAGWSVIFLTVCYLASTWFWPWYVLWGVVAAALAPAHGLGRWTLFLSWSALLLYGALGYGDSDLWWVQTYRSLAVFGLPVALFALDALPRVVRWCATLATRLLRRRASSIRQQAAANDQVDRHAGTPIDRPGGPRRAAAEGTSAPRVR